jgi:hypothetical protein
MAIKISVYLQTAFAAQARLGQGQWVLEQLNVVKPSYVPSRNTNNNNSIKLFIIYVP